MPVTPQGVRDGDRRSLTGLAQRRSGSVYDYALHVCGEASAMDATAEAFARFRGAVFAADDPSALAPDTLLLSCTRHASAALAPASGHRPECPATPYLVIGRLEGSNPVVDEARLTKHLALCGYCADRAESFNAAERAFRAPHPSPPDSAVVDRVVAALLSAAPTVDTALDRDVQEAVPVQPSPPAAAVVVITQPGRGDEATDAEGSPEAANLPSSAPGPADDSLEESVLADDSFAAPVPAQDPRHEVVPRVVVPAAIVAAATVVVMAVAGVFGGTSPAPARGQAGLPSPAPPAQPPPADDETQTRAIREAREALRRIEARDRTTTRAAEQERRSKALEERTTEPPAARAVPDTATRQRETARAAPTPRPQAQDDGGSDPEADSGSLETVPPADTGDPSSVAPEFVPGQPQG